MGLTVLGHGSWLDFPSENQRFGLLLWLGREGWLSEDFGSFSGVRNTGMEPLILRRGSTAGEEVEERSGYTEGILPLELAGFVPGLVRLTGETRWLLRLDRLGKEPDAGGED